MLKKVASILLGSMIVFSSISYVEAATSDEVITTAKQYIGVPYRWGGETTKGFDCSGFLNFVFIKHGIDLPRTVAEIYKVGTVVSKSNLKKGDIIFFQTYKKGASHAGIYLGDGNFIHAGSSTGVTISNMNSSYWKPKYVGAKRLLQDKPKLADGEFYDVPKNYWAYAEISAFSDKGIIKGYTDQTFHPNASISRAEAAKIVATFLNIPLSDNISHNDVKNNHWARIYISAVVEKGIFKGTGDGNFSPNAPLTRAEFATIIQRMYALEEKGDVVFSDVDNNHWAVNSISVVSSNGIFKGYGDGTFRPNQSTSRAEFVSVLSRVEGMTLR